MRLFRFAAEKKCRRIAMFLFAVLPSGSLAADTYPAYSAQSIVNSATQTVEALAPNSIATIYGSNLSFTTNSAGPAVTGSILPTTLEGVTVLVNGLFGHLFYVSPTQINFLIPYELIAGTVSVVVVRQSAAGPSVKIDLNATSPGLFAWTGTAQSSTAPGTPPANYAIAVHLNGALISPNAPATAGELVVLYAEGLGRVTPDTTSGRLASSAAPIVAAAQMQILLAGKPLPAANTLYAGLAPGYAGLYQINFRLPDPLPSNPEIRVSFGALVSPALIFLPTQTSVPMPVN